ncbi:hypothetical protein ACWFMI_02305 [Nocardiopsis terrae]
MFLVAYSVLLLLVAFLLFSVRMYLKKSSVRLAPGGWEGKGSEEVREDIHGLEGLQGEISRVRGSVQGQLQVLALAVRETEDSDGPLFPYHPGSLERSAERSREAVEGVRRRYRRVASASVRSSVAGATLDWV